MWSRLKFALVYVSRGLLRGRQRALFAALSIAAGVATVVTLRILGLMLTDALVANAQEFLRADILVAPASAPIRLGVETTPFTRPIFLAEDTREIRQWALAHDVDVTFQLTGQLMQLSPVADANAAQNVLALAYFVDPDVYPFYDQIQAAAPEGAPLEVLLNEPFQVVLSERAARQLGVDVGDEISVSTAEEPHTVAGIVPDESENNLDNPFGLAFSFIYLDIENAALYGLQPGSADRAYLKVSEGVDPEVFVEKVYADFHDMVPFLEGKHIRFDRIANIIARNAVIANLVSRSILLLSLVALLIGGVGIINTMFVSVNRRAEEIAVLKSVGLRRADILNLFVTHALIVGLMGTIGGVIAGLLLSLLARSVGETTFGVELQWRFSFDPVLMGIALGLGTTVIFGLLPIMTAARVRPRRLLQQGSIPLIQSSPGAVLLVASLLILSLGVIVGSIIRTMAIDAGLSPLVLGVVITSVTFLALTLTVAVLWLVVWFLSRLPALGSAHLKLALRDLSRHRGRTAFTLLALVIGMSTLSGTLILSRSISQVIATSISEPLGGNLIIVPLLPLTPNLVRDHLEQNPAVSGYRDLHVGFGYLMAIDGNNEVSRRSAPTEDTALRDLYIRQLQTITGVQVAEALQNAQLVEGRHLTPEDAGHYRLVIPDGSARKELGIHVGSTLTYYIGGDIRDFEVVGIVQPAPQANLVPFGLGSAAVQAPAEVVPQDLPFTLMVADVRPADLPALSKDLSAIPGVIAVDVSTFDTVINRVLRQFAALPLLVAGLSLFAASILVATTVSLSVMERRRQIGVLKALGLKRWQALGQLLVESGLIGLVGGVLSLLPTLLLIRLVPVITDNLVRLPLPVDLFLLMLGLSIAITLAATLLTAWRASSESPIHTLRYE